MDAYDYMTQRQVDPYKLRHSDNYTGLWGEEYGNALQPWEWRKHEEQAWWNTEAACRRALEAKDEHDAPR